MLRFGGPVHQIFLTINFEELLDELLGVPPEAELIFPDIFPNSP